MYRDAEQNLKPSREVVWTGTMRAGDVTAPSPGLVAHRHPRRHRQRLRITFGITRRTGVTWVNYLSDVARGHVVSHGGLGDPDAGGKALATSLETLARGHDPARYLPDLRAAARRHDTCRSSARRAAACGRGRYGVRSVQSSLTTAR